MRRQRCSCAASRNAARKSVAVMSTYPNICVVHNELVSVLLAHWPAAPCEACCATLESLTNRCECANPTEAKTSAMRASGVEPPSSSAFWLTRREQQHSSAISRTRCSHDFSLDVSGQNLKVSVCTAGSNGMTSEGNLRTWFHCRHSSVPGCMLAR
jgi:hypothetical protein